MMTTMCRPYSQSQTNTLVVSEGINNRDSRKLLEANVNSNEFFYFFIFSFEKEKEYTF